MLLEWVKENLEFDISFNAARNCKGMDYAYKKYFKGCVTEMTVPWLMQLVTIL